MQLLVCVAPSYYDLEGIFTLSNFTLFVFFFFSFFFHVSHGPHAPISLRPAGAPFAYAQLVYSQGTRKGVRK